MARVSWFAWALPVLVGSCVAAGGTGTRRLRIEKAGAGHGVVTVTPRGLRCDSHDTSARECEPELAAGSVVALSAIADADSAFVGWSGASCHGPGMCVVTLDRAATVEARFELRPGARGWMTRLGRQVDVFGTAVAADRTDDVYVIGVFVGDAVFDRPHKSQGTDGQSDIFVARFSRASNQWEWSARIGGDEKEEVYGIAVSDDGKTVAVAGGYSEEVDFAGKHKSKGGQDAFVAVFQHKDGELQPAAWLDYGSTTMDVFGAVTLVRANRAGKSVQRVVVAGLTTDLKTVLGAAEEGKWIWGPCSLEARGDLFKMGLAAGTGGSAVLLTSVQEGDKPLSFSACDATDTSEIAAASATDMVLVKLDSATGRATWKVPITGEGEDGGRSVSVGAGGEIAILRGARTSGEGEEGGGSTPACILSVYRDTGAPLWERVLGLGNDYLPGHVAIVGDKVYAVANVFDGTAHHDKTAAVVTVWPLVRDAKSEAASDRALREARITATHDGVMATGLAVGATGAPFVGGVYAGELSAGTQRAPSLGSFNLMAVSLTPSLTATWAHQPQGAGHHMANAVAPLAEGRLAIAGGFNGRFGQGFAAYESVGGHDAVVQIVNAAGKPEVAPVILGGPEYDNAYVVAPWGNGFVVGGQTGSDGLLAWVADPNAPVPGLDDARLGASNGGVVEGLAVSGGGMLVAGGYKGTTRAIPKLPKSDARRAFVALFKGPSVPLWQAALGQEGESEARAVAALGEQAVVAGWFSGTICDGEERKRSKGGQDAFVAVGDEKGWRCWTWGGEKTDDVAKAVSVDAAGRIAVGVEIREAMDGGPRIISASAADDVDQSRVIVLDASLQEELARSMARECGRSVAGVELTPGGVLVATYGQRDRDLRGCSRIIKLRPRGAHLWSRVFEIEGSGSLTAGGKTPGITFYGMARVDGRLILVGDLAGTLLLPFGREAGGADGDFLVVSLDEGEVAP